MLLLFAFILQNQTQRPMSEMQGGCDHYALNLTREFAAWDGVPLNLIAAGAPANPATCSLDQKLSVSLPAMADVAFLSPPPEGKRGFTGTFGGMLKLAVTERGRYRFCMGAKVWIDVIDRATNTPLKDQMFEMQTQCDKIFKVVIYELDPAAEYVLQLAYAPSPQLPLLITPQD